MSSGNGKRPISWWPKGVMLVVPCILLATVAGAYLFTGQRLVSSMPLESVLREKDVIGVETALRVPELDLITTGSVNPVEDIPRSGEWADRPPIAQPPVPQMEEVASLEPPTSGPEPGIPDSIPQDGSKPPSNCVNCEPASLEEELPPDLAGQPGDTLSTSGPAANDDDWLSRNADRNIEQILTEDPVEDRPRVGSDPDLMPALRNAQPQGSFTSVQEPATEPAPCGLCNQLEDAKLTYNDPKEMYYGRETVIQLALLPKFVTDDPAAVLDESIEGDRIIVNNVEYSLRMRATLNGPAFDITPERAIDRTVLPTKVTKWTWTVVPQEYGTRNLSLELVAILMDGDRELPPTEVRTFRRDITIHVSAWDRAVIAAQSITKVHAAIAAVGGTILSVGWWIVARFRKPKPEKPSVVEVILRNGNDKPTGGQGASGA